MQDEVIQLSDIFNSTWGHAAVWFGALWAIYLFINKVSKDAEEVLHPDKRKALSDELLRIKDRDASSWLPDFTTVFDRFFGKKHLSWRCFYKSSLMSVFVFSALIYLYAPPGIGLDDKHSFLAFSIIAAIFLNVFIDYISLLETRIMLSIQIHVLAKIILDAVITTLLVFAWLVLLLSFSNLVLIILNIPGTLEFNFELVTKVWKELFYEFGSDSILMHITLATSFTTSIWLWLHGLSSVLIRSLSNIQKFMGWLNVKETPLRAIGTTINLIVLTFGVLLFPVYLFY